MEETRRQEIRVMEEVWGGWVVRKNRKRGKKKNEAFLERKLNYSSSRERT